MITAAIQPQTKQNRLANKQKLCKCCFVMCDERNAISAAELLHNFTYSRDKANAAI